MSNHPAAEGERVIPLPDRAAARPADGDAAAVLAEAFLHAPEAMAVWDRQHRLIQCNAAYRLLNASIADLLTPGARVVGIARAAAERGLLPPATDPDAWACDRLVPSVPGQPAAEDRTLQGRRVRRTVVATRGGLLIESLVDTTEERRREAALRHEQTRLNAILAALPDLVVRADGRGRCRAVWDHDPATAAGADLAGLGLEAVFAPELAARFEAHLAAVRTTGRLQVLNYEAAAADGVRRFEARSVPVAGDGTLSIIRDTTQEKAREDAMRHQLAELKSAQVQLRDQAEQLGALAKRFEAERLRAEEANATRSAFLANMSHELRTPLNAVIGFAGLMKSQMLGSMGNERYLQYAHDIHDSGSLLLSLINDILDLSKIEAGGVEIEPRLVDIRYVVASCLRLVGDRARQNGLELTSDVPEPCPPVYADERVLKQMMVNLLSNAIKFTPPGGSVRLSVATANDGGARVAVSDTGVGIAAADLPTVFEPFRQVKRDPHRPRPPGTGLGLPLVKALIERHGGRIEIDSRPGAGTTVGLILPPAPPTGAHPSPAATPHRPSA